MGDGNDILAGNSGKREAHLQVVNQHRRPTATVLAEVERGNGAGGLRVNGGGAGVRFSGGVEPERGGGSINVVAEDEGGGCVGVQVAGHHGIGVGGVGDIEAECPGGSVGENAG